MQSLEGGQASLAEVIRTLKSFVQPSPSIEGHKEPQSDPVTPTQPSRPQLSTTRSPSDNRIRAMSGPLKPSLSPVDSLSTTRYEGGPKRVSFDHMSAGPSASMQNLTNGEFPLFDVQPLTYNCLHSSSAAPSPQCQYYPSACPSSSSTYCSQHSDQGSFVASLWIKLSLGISPSILAALSYPISWRTMGAQGSVSPAVAPG